MNLHIHIDKNERGKTYFHKNERGHITSDQTDMKRHC